jgi:hypothetical protein
MGGAWGRNLRVPKKNAKSLFHRAMLLVITCFDYKLFTGLYNCARVQAGSWCW